MPFVEGLAGEECRVAFQTLPNRAAVLALLAECLAQYPPERTKDLPPLVQRIIQDPYPDIQGNAVLLRQAELKLPFGGGESDELVREIAHLFAAASTRLGQIHGREIPAG